MYAPHVNYSCVVPVMIIQVMSKSDASIIVNVVNLCPFVSQYLKKSHLSKRSEPWILPQISIDCNRLVIGLYPF